MAQKSPDQDELRPSTSGALQEAAQKPSWTSAFSNQKLYRKLSLGGAPHRTQLACNRIQNMVPGTSQNFGFSYFYLSFFFFFLSCCDDCEGKGDFNLFLLWLEVVPRRGNQLEQLSSLTTSSV